MESDTMAYEFDRSAVAASAGVGLFAAVIGYLLTYVLVGSKASEEFGDSVPDWTGVAWFYYNAHLVDIEVTGAVGSIGGSNTVNFIAQSGATNATALYVVPPLVLVGAGVLVARQWAIDDIGAAVLTGAPVAIGYGTVMTLGAIVAETSSERTVFGVEASGSMGPELLPAIVIAGFLYPLVFATAGSVLVAVVDR